MTCALQRKESRGSHFRSDHPETDNSLACASIITYDSGQYRIRMDKEHYYES